MKYCLKEFSWNVTFFSFQYVFCLLLVFLVETAAALICLYFRLYFPIEVRTNLKLKLENEYGMDMQEIFTDSLDFTQYEVGTQIIS